jgi:hypothetical protein
MGGFGDGKEDASEDRGGEILERAVLFHEERVVTGRDAATFRVFQFHG